MHVCVNFQDLIETKERKKWLAGFFHHHGEYRLAFFWWQECKEIMTKIENGFNDEYPGDHILEPLIDGLM